MTQGTCQHCGQFDDLVGYTTKLGRTVFICQKCEARRTSEPVWLVSLYLLFGVLLIAFLVWGVPLLVVWFAA